MTDDEGLDTLTGTIDVSGAKAFIRDLQCQIEERTAELREKIERIRQRAKADEIYEADRAWHETEVLRRQMEAMIKTVAEYESIQMPPRTIILAEHS